MRITAADDAAAKLRQRKGDVSACVLQIPATKRTPEKFRIYKDDATRSATAKEVIDILGLTRLPATVLHDMEIPDGSFVWVFPENLNRY